MFTTLRIQNFQVWKNLSLDLGPLTVVLGPSGYGKSAILRAFSALVDTRAGTEFITHGKFVTSVCLNEQQDVALTYAKTDAGSASYRLVTAVADPDLPDIELTFDKVGRQTPQEVVDYLNLPEFEVDGEKFILWRAGQFDRPFVLFDSPQSAARLLTAITGVDKLTMAQKAVGRDRTALVASTKMNKASLTSAESVLAANRWKSASEHYVALQSNIEFFKKIDSALTRVNNANWSKTRKPKNLISFPDTSAVEKIRTDLQRIPKQVPAPKPEVSWAAHYIDTYIDSALEYRRRLEGLDTHRRQLNLALDGLRKAQIAKAEIEAEYHIFIEEHGGVCPFCGQPLGER